MAYTPATRQYVIGFDGTGNTAEVQEKYTNIYKLKELFRPLDEPPFYYLPGVGTRINEAVAGNAWGSGISTRLLEAYRWLTDQMNYPGRALDNFGIYVFGFSRGAYIARLFCWLVSLCGIPTKPVLCDELYGHFVRNAVQPGKFENFLAQVQAWRNAHADSFTAPEITMLGVFDTVKTADFGNRESQLDNALASCVKVAYHAMALDEVRKLFPVTHFAPDERVHELWFAGCHSDIGGGYPEDGLSNIALQWMLDNAIENGLHFVNRPPRQDIEQTVHDESVAPLWKGFPKVPRTVAESDAVHESVKAKLQTGKYQCKARLPAKPHFVQY